MLLHFNVFSVTLLTISLLLEANFDNKLVVAFFTVENLFHVKGGDVSDHLLGL